MNCTIHDRENSIGLPFTIASHALPTHMLARQGRTQPNIKRRPILDDESDDIDVVGHEHPPAMKAPVAV